MTKEWGGWWTEAKLEILDKYLAAFGNASRKAGGTVYLDLFGGSVTHLRPDTGAEYLGSTSRAMRSLPPFSRLVFWELTRKAENLRTDLAAAFPDDTRYRVVGGDCNLTSQEGLDQVADLQWAPTFAFIDPKGIDVSWATLETLSKWRRDRRGRKVELWILLPEPAFERVLGLKGVRGNSSATKLNNLYGTDDWIPIHQGRWTGKFSPEQTRAEFVNLYRWRIEKVLGYKTTHALQLGNVNDQPVYTMVFATDAAAGSRIMGDVYHHAKVHEIPLLRAHAVSARRRTRERAAGVLSLFEVGEVPVTSEGYRHTEPWEPPARLDESVELDAEPPPEDDEDDS